VNQLIVVGAGGFGREIFGWAQQVDSDQRDWEVAGFLDARSDSLDVLNLPARIFGDPDTFTPQDYHRFVCGIGRPRTKLQLVEKLMLRGAKFITLIHPSVIVGPNCQIGPGSVLCPRVVLTTNVRLGRFVALNVATTVGHDALIGDGCTLDGHVDVIGNAVLGKGVFVGSHAAILPGARVEDFTTVGVGDVILRNVAEQNPIEGAPTKRTFRSASIRPVSNSVYIDD